jgi:ferredoxin-thioredoxin reductase catalytic subunit
MSGKNQHAVKRSDGWAVLGENNERDTAVYKTQEKAIKEAVKIAKNQHSEVVIHGIDGKIRDKDSYGKDTCPPLDKKH